MTSEGCVTLRVALDILNVWQKVARKIIQLMILIIQCHFVKIPVEPLSSKIDFRCISVKLGKDSSSK